MLDVEDRLPIVNGHDLSHGTLECYSLKESKQFYREFLGLACVRHAQEAQLISSSTHPWSVVCVEAGEGVHPQGREYRWGVQVASPDDVDGAHSAALAHKDEFAIRHVDEIAERDGIRSFSLQDRDGNWWEIEHAPHDYYENLFRKG